MSTWNAPASLGECTVVRINKEADGLRTYGCGNAILQRNDRAFAQQSDARRRLRSGPFSPSLAAIPRFSSDYLPMGAGLAVWDIVEGDSHEGRDTNVRRPGFSAF